MSTVDPHKSEKYGTRPCSDWQNLTVRVREEEKGGGGGGRVIEVSKETKKGRKEKKREKKMKEKQRPTEKAMDPSSTRFFLGN